MKPGQALTTLHILCCLHIAVTSPDQPTNVASSKHHTAPRNTFIPGHIAQNIDTSTNVAPNNISTKVAPNASVSDMSEEEALWFLLDTVLSSFMMYEKNRQGVVGGTLSAFGFCPVDRPVRKIIGGKGMCVEESDDYY